ncbi:CoA transferase [Arsenicitalea aurantiaca]|uniref:CoA transferase n=1 Tax=Arsenicitalea aurantiaca TaxID=1783274 RepID=A0A433XEG0_9HYPH|nr:CaiB/BaiF CoA-transferase family protein [Arsenicitalea aurantiaca]RUT32501.1 CoA transferase [Arsenicitalea aurantiaca]
MNKALNGVTILDFSHLLQGPFATQLLADMGANVIKIERAGSGDMFRSMTFFAKWVGGSESPNFLAWNRNKRSLALNLKSPEVHAIIMEMAKKADVVVQNFRPGVLAKLGYGYEDFKAVNPGIIYCSGSGYGEDGPYVTRPGQDMLIQGLSGLMANTGRGDQNPVPVGAGLADQIGAMNMVYGILSALYYREKTGIGQKIEVNLLAGLIAHLNQEYVGVLNLGEDFVRPNSGIGHPGMQAPFGVYETADGGYVTIAMSPFKTLYETLEAPALAVYDDLGTLFEKRDEVWEKVNAETKKFGTADLLDRLLAADIWCAEVKDIRKAAEDPQVTHLGLITSYEHPRAGTVRVVGPAIRMSETQPTIDRPAPLVGQHGREILAEFGISAETIARLEEGGDMTVSEA